MTWHEVAARYPEFVQWVVATFGPLPDGDVDEGDFERYSAAWTAHIDGPDDSEGMAS